MKKLKYLQRFFMLLFTGFALCAVQACGNDEKNEQGTTNGLKGWYTDLSSVAKESDFNEINKAIHNHEVLSSYRYDGEIHEYVASRDLFFNDDGYYNDYESYFGRLRFSITSQITVIHILDEQTLQVYYASLYETGTSKEDAVYSFYAGPIFGNMTYYGSPSYYTFFRVDNKLILSNGDIYTVTSSGLIKDGDTTLLSKYDPAKTNTNGNNDGNNSNHTSIIQGHEYVDLGLSVKWATCNVGASSPEEYGDYYAWGETTPKTSNAWYSYKWLDNPLKYNDKDKLTVLEPQDDVAAVQWGSEWRIPTNSEFDELLNECTWKWTKQGDIKGYEVKAKNGKQIFLPAAGSMYDGNLYRGNDAGFYWTATLTYLDHYAETFDFSQNGTEGGFKQFGHNGVSQDRCKLRTIRPVTK